MKSNRVFSDSSSVSTDLILFYIENSQKKSKEVNDNEDCNGT